MDYSVSTICFSSHPCHTEYLQQLLPLISPPALVVVVKPWQRGESRIGMWLPRCACVQMRLGAPLVLQRSGVHLATQSKSWRYTTGMLCCVNPLPVHKQRQVMSVPVQNPPCLNKAGLFHLLESHSFFNPPIPASAVCHHPPKGCCLQILHHQAHKHSAWRARPLLGEPTPGTEHTALITDDGLSLDT